jgi:Ankyrin repeats (3 copies)/Ankyrin repeat
MGGRFSRRCCAATLFAAALFTPAMAATQLSKPDQQLYDAVDAGNAAGVTQALSQGANIEVKDRFGHGLTPLLEAYDLQKFDIVTLLVDHNANIEATVPGGTTILWVAAATGNAAMATLLLDHHANIEVKGLDGDTPLGVAAATGQIEIVKLLLEHHANAQAKNDAGETPLQKTSEAIGPRDTVRPEIVRLLTEYQNRSATR